MRTMWKFAGAIASCLAVEVVCYLMLYILERRRKKPRDRSVTFRTLFVSDEKQKCREHIIHRTSCGVNCSLDQVRTITQIIDDAKFSVDVCVLHITMWDIADAIIEAHKRQVKVRVMSEHNFAFESGSLMEPLQLEGVEVRLKQKWRDMHNKFMIVDRNILVFGSANWTLSAFCLNWENIIVRYGDPCIPMLAEFFDALWEEQNDERSHGDE